MPETAPTVYPSLRYRDARAGIDWLKDTFGFVERVVYANDFDGPVGSTFPEWTSSPITFLKTVSGEEGSLPAGPVAT